MMLPDTTPVRIFSCLGESYVSTLGDACRQWRDARHFGIDGALRRKGEWHSLGLTIRLEPAGSDPGEFQNTGS